MRFPMSLRWSSYAPLSPQRGSQKRKTADFRLKSHSRNFVSNWTRWSEIADLRSLFARSDSAETPSEKNSIKPAITPKRYEIVCQLLLITNRKSHGFRLVPISMTLNAVIAFILRFFSSNSTDFQADYITVFEDRPIISVKYCLPFPVFHFWPIL